MCLSRWRGRFFWALFCPLSWRPTRGHSVGRPRQNSAAAVDSQAQRAGLIPKYKPKSSGIRVDPAFAAAGDFAGAHPVAHRVDVKTERGRKRRRVNLEPSPVAGDRTHPTA